MIKNAVLIISTILFVSSCMPQLKKSDGQGSNLSEKTVTMEAPSIESFKKSYGDACDKGLNPKKLRDAYALKSPSQLTSNCAILMDIVDSYKLTVVQDDNAPVEQEGLFSSTQSRELSLKVDIKSSYEIKLIYFWSKDLVVKPLFQGAVRITKDDLAAVKIDTLNVNIKLTGTKNSEEIYGLPFSEEIAKGSDLKIILQNEFDNGQPNDQIQTVVELLDFGTTYSDLSTGNTKTIQDELIKKYVGKVFKITGSLSFSSYGFTPTIPVSQTYYQIHDIGYPSSIVKRDENPKSTWKLSTLLHLDESKYDVSSIPKIEVPKPPSELKTVEATGRVAGIDFKDFPYIHVIFDKGQIKEK